MSVIKVKNEEKVTKEAWSINSTLNYTESTLIGIGTILSATTDRFNNSENVSHIRWAGIWSIYIGRQT